jgi:hypothetical protein
MKCAVRTYANAIPAVNAPFFKVNQFRFARLTLGVVTPATAQWTALEKYRGSNPRTIVERETHQIENKT